MPGVSALQLIGGLLVLFGGTLPLGLCILCPITVNILLFHMCPSRAATSSRRARSPACWNSCSPIWAYRANFNGILTIKAVPMERA